MGKARGYSLIELLAALALLSTVVHGLFPLHNECKGIWKKYRQD